MSSPYERLRVRGLLTLRETAAMLDISTSTVKTWHRHGLIRGHRYNDKNERLYEPPGDQPPVKQPRAGSSRKDFLRACLPPNIRVRCSMKPSPYRDGCGPPCVYEPVVRGLKTDIDPDSRSESEPKGLINRVLLSSAISSGGNELFCLHNCDRSGNKQSTVKNSDCILHWESFNGVPFPKAGLHSALVQCSPALLNLAVTLHSPP